VAIINSENQFRGAVMETKLMTSIDKHIEELEILGFTIVENVLNQEELSLARKKSMKFM
jgi:hypothetical protein